MENNKRIVIAGSGNLATRLALALKKAGWKIVQVYSRTESHASELAHKIGCEFTSELDKVNRCADIYIISVKDDAISDLAGQLCDGRTHAVFLHTAGSVSMDVFMDKAKHYGVLYPMQSFSKTREVDFKEIPCFVEASDDSTLADVKAVADSITDVVRYLDSDKRKRLHLAAVFASNLTNHCYRLAERVLTANGLDFSLMLPLIKETADKVVVMSPHEAQTGPMVRYDTNVMEMQLALIDDERTRQIYRLMAESIHSDY